MMRDFFYGIGDLFEQLWAIVPYIGNIPNYISILIISVLFIYWTIKLVQYSRKGEA